MCKTTSAGVRPHPLLRQVHVQVPLAPPTEEEKKAAASSISFPLGLPFSIPQNLNPSAPSAPQYQPNSFLLPSSTAPSAVPPPPAPPAAASVPKPQHANPASSGSHKQRMVRPACVNCRRSKVRCEGGIPCKRCMRLGLDHSCQRCQPKKRGRKRKPSDEAHREGVSASGPSSSMEQPKRLKVAPSVVPLTEESARHSVEHFAFLTSQFRNWREKLTNDPQTDKIALSRFLYFCSYLSHVVKDYMDSHQAVPEQDQQQRVLSDWLCSNLAEDVHRFVENVGTDIVCFPEVSSAAADNSSSSILQLNVEKQVFKQIPMGAVMLPLHPYPFHPQEKAWVNDNMSTLLGYDRDQLKELFSRRDSFLRLLHPSSLTKFIGQFWDAVSCGKSHYSGSNRWLHKTGEPFELTGTFSIKYKNGLPVRWSLFFQAAPDDLERLQLLQSTALSVSESLSVTDSAAVSPSDSKLSTSSSSGPSVTHAEAPSTCNLSLSASPVQTPLADSLPESDLFQQEVKSPDMSSSLSLHDDLPQTPVTAPPPQDYQLDHCGKQYGFPSQAIKGHGWADHQPTGSSVLDMLLAQQPELEYA